MMHSSFWFDVKLDDILIKNVSVNSAAGMGAVCVIMVVVTVLYEAMRVLLASIKLNSSAMQSNHQHCVTDNTQLIVNGPLPQKRRLVSFLAEILLYSMEAMLAYALMLIVMTYNGYIFISVLVGTLIAYAFLGHRMMLIRLKYRNLKMPCRVCNGSKTTLSGGSGSSEMQPTTDQSEQVNPVPHCHLSAASTHM